MNRACRRELLERIEEQVASGELIVRQATPEERERYGIKLSEPPKTPAMDAVVSPPKAPKPKRVLVQPPCEFCGAVIERKPKHHVRRYCTRTCAARAREAGRGG
jgi:hypothetical protein